MCKGAPGGVVTAWWLGVAVVGVSLLVWLGVVGGVRFGILGLREVRRAMSRDSQNAACLWDVGDGKVSQWDGVWREGHPIQ
eukprot:15624238-Heterocapsa_arctica.AAC.1